MSTKTIKNNANNIQVRSNRQRRTKSSLSTNAAHEVNKKQIISTSKRNKALLTCVICDGDAHGSSRMINLEENFFKLFYLGYNFDAITCESCKAFFRRNALRPVVMISFP